MYPMIMILCSIFDASYDCVTFIEHIETLTKGVGWLVVLGLTALETVFQSLSGRLPKRGRKRREMIDESKNVQTTTRTHRKRSRPLPYCNKNCRTPWNWKFTQHPPDHPQLKAYKINETEFQLNKRIGMVSLDLYSIRFYVSKSKP